MKSVNHLSLLTQSPPLQGPTPLFAGKTPSKKSALRPTIETDLPGTGDSVTVSSATASLTKVSPHIRGSHSLNPTRVAQTLEAQIQPYTPKDIEGIAQAVSPEEPALALEVLKQMTPFATMNSLNTLGEYLLSSKNEGIEPLGDDRPGTFSAVMSYLASKGNFQGLYPMKSFRKWLREAPQKGTSQGCILLDDTLLKTLTQKEKLHPHLSNLKLLVPSSGLDGVTPFNQGNLGMIQEKAATVFNRAKAMQEQTSCAWPEAVQKALEAPIRERIRSINPELEKNIQFIPPPGRPSPEGPLINVPKESKGSDNPLIGDILNQLQPPTSRPQNIQKVLATLSPEPVIQQAALEVVERSAQIYSPRRTGQALLNTHDKVMALAEKKDIPLQNIYYILPDNHSSFTVINHMMQQLSGLPAKQFIDLSQHGEPVSRIEEKIKQGEKCLFVILDDLCGSGMTLGDGIESIRTFIAGSSKHSLVVAPIISTEQGQRNVQNSAKKYWKDINNFHYLPDQTVQAFHETAYYKSLNKNERLVIDAIVQGRGYLNANTSCVFPWMGSDTNSAFWREFFVTPNTLNGNGNAIFKDIDEDHPVPNQKWQPLNEESLKAPVAALRKRS
ncbi:MAG: hypothetical protein K2X66_11250 [Cyanobacteria bacterium]|nr:hypothetical protein [Cyanobacteriota bacterium]